MANISFSIGFLYLCRPILSIDKDTIDKMKANKLVSG